MRRLGLAFLLVGAFLLLFSAFNVRVERWSLEDAPIFMGWSLQARLGIGLGVAMIVAGVVWLKPRVAKGTDTDQYMEQRRRAIRAKRRDAARIADLEQQERKRG